MDLGAAIVARLVADTTVNGLTGGRVSWVRRKQGDALPAVVLSGVGGSADDLLVEDADIIESLVQADCYAETHVAAWALARAVTAALKEAATVGGFEFWNSEISRPVDLGEQTDEGFVHRAMLNMTIRHGIES